VSLNSLMEREARLFVLQTLAAEPDYRRNTRLLRQNLAEICGISRTLEWLHQQVAVLEELEAVKRKEIGDLLIVSITPRGLSHVRGEIVLDGVSRPAPEA
jgi:hypothetical protein